MENKPYSMVKEHPHAYEMKHPDGTNFLVAKHGLDDGMHQRIKSYADGGVVEDAPVVVPAAPEIVPERVVASNIIGAPSVAPNPVDNFTPDPAQLREEYNKLLPYYGKDPSADKLSDTGGKVDPTIFNQAKSNLVSKQQDAQSAQSDLAAKASQEAKQREALGFPSTQPSGGTIASNDLMATKEATKIIPISGQQSKSIAPSVAGGVAPYNMVEQGLREEAKAKSGESQANTAILDSYINQQQQVAVQTQEKLKNYQATTDQIMKDLSTANVDPTKYMANKSFGNKVAGAIAIALGAYAQGINGGENVAYKIIQQAQDADIKAQQANIDNKQNLLAKNLEATKSYEAAVDLTKGQQLAMVQVQLQRTAAKASSPIELAKLKQAIGGIEQQKNAYLQSAAEKSALNNLTGGAQAGEINVSSLPKDSQPLAVKLPNGKLGLAYSKEGAEKTREAFTNLQDIGSQVDNAVNFITNRGPAIPFTDKAAEADNIASSIELSLNKLHGLNRLTDIEFNQFKKMVPNPGTFRTEKGLAQLMTIKRLIKEKTDAELENNIQGYRKQTAPKSFVMNKGS